MTSQEKRDTRPDAYMIRERCKEMGLKISYLLDEANWRTKSNVALSRFSRMISRHVQTELTEKFLIVADEILKEWEKGRWNP